MKKKIVLFAIFSILLFAAGAETSYANDLSSTENVDLTQEMADFKKKIADLEAKVAQNEKENNNLLQSAMSQIHISGGMSGGSFYTSNPGPEETDNEFLLSNFLVELSSENKDLPVGFVGAFGETSTPSVLDTPENNDVFDIEYASLAFKPISGMSLEAGLLQPNAGFECTYTYNNRNIMLGALASQQPYNAYGARLGYSFSSFHLSGGYYKKRLDDEEYEVNESSPDDSWEIGLCGSALETEFSIYHYHLVGMRNLTGAFIERSFGNVDMAVNIDYWRWDAGLKKDFGRDYALGGAVYVAPKFGRFSLPVRLEYIDQGRSCIYIENMDAKHIYAATISPTYNFYENAYIRIESAYVNADNAFADKNGKSENSRVCLAAEIGYIF